MLHSRKGTRDRRSTVNLTQRCLGIFDSLVKSITVPYGAPRVAPWEHSLPCRLPADIMAADALTVPEPIEGGRPAHQSAAYDAMMARKRRRG